MVNALPRVLSLVIGAVLSAGLALVQPPVADAASSTTKQKFIASLVGVAQETQRSFGVPASVSIAQAIEASSWGSSAQVSKGRNYFDTRCSASMTADQFAKLAEAQVGKRYLLGALARTTNPDPAKFDCSELVKWIFARSGNPITDLAASQYNATRKVTGSPKVGDLVFLRNNPARSNGIGHVAVLTKKKSNGDWEIVEARGHSAGVVKTTLSYWKKRPYYAALRRYSKFALAGRDGVTASAAKTYQVGCVTIGSTKYATFGSMADSFRANATAITRDSAYKRARAAMSSVPRFVDELAKVVQPKKAAAYAASLKSLIATYHLTDYDIVPIKLVLLSGDSGFRVTALQYLLKAAGYSTKITGTYDSGTVSTVKKFQKAKKLEVDGEAGRNTLTALFGTLKAGTSGTRTSALNALLGGLGHAPSRGGDFGSATVSALKSFQADAGRGHDGRRQDQAPAQAHRQPRRLGTGSRQPVLPVVPRHDPDQRRDRGRVRRAARRRRPHPGRGGDRDQGRLHRHQPHVRGHRQGRQAHVLRHPGPEGQRHGQGRQDPDGQGGGLEARPFGAVVPVVPRVDGHQGRHEDDLQAHQVRQGQADHRRRHRSEGGLHERVRAIGEDPRGGRLTALTPQPSSRAKSRVRTTSSPASSHSSRSTRAVIDQSWLPSGSSMIWRTSQTRPCSVITSRAGPRASASAGSTSCSSQ